MATPTILIIPDRYKSGVLYSQLPDSGAVDFDVTRATDAYRTNASGILESVASGVPRLDYPALGGCPSLLVEPAATNLLLRSEQFDDAAWTKTGLTVTSNATTAPNGLLTADSIVTAASGVLDVRVAVSIPVAGAFTVSRYVKKGTGISWVYAPLGYASSSAWFNLDTGQVGTVQAGLISASITNAGNGWYRITQTGSFTGSLAVRAIAPADSDNNINFNGTIGSNLFLWGAQLETGSVATSYIPTVAATATRNADVISKTGVSGFIGQLEGYLYAEVSANNYSATTRRVLCLSDGTINNRVLLSGIIGQQNRYQAVVVTGGATLTQIVTTIDYAENTPIKMAMAYANNDVVFYVNGSQIGIDTSVSIPTTSRIDVGNLLNSEQFINGRIRAAAIGTTRISNAELAAMTAL
jgi:hypothetical protein